MRGLDKRLSDEMSAERRSAGETESWSGLKILKGKVKDAINNAVDHQVAWEKAAGIKPEDGIEGRLGQSDAGADVPAADGDAVTGARAVSGEASLGNAREDWIRMQAWEKHALRTADLEILSAVRAWRKKQAGTIRFSIPAEI